MISNTKTLKRCTDCKHTFWGKPDEVVCRYCYYWGDNPEAELRWEQLRRGGK